MSDDQELKACPFCGGKVVRDFVNDSYTADVDCDNCESFRMDDEWWNTRPIEDAKDAIIDSLRVELKVSDQWIEIHYKEVQSLKGKLKKATYSHNNQGEKMLSDAKTIDELREELAEANEVLLRTVSAFEAYVEESVVEKKAIREDLTEAKRIIEAVTPPQCR